MEGADWLGSSKMTSAFVSLVPGLMTLFISRIILLIPPLWPFLTDIHEYT
jgi:hypothetical protein